MSQHEVLDLSTYNTVTNYSSIGNNIDGVIIRAGYRGYGSSGTLTTDKKFEAHYSGLNGKTKMGVYWLSQAITTSEAVAEANYVYNLIKNKTIHFPVYLDSEWANSSHTGRADSLSKAARTSITIAFCERIKELGYRAGVYASDSWFVSNLDWTQLSANGYSLWVARYSSSPPKNVSKYDAWQYTSSGSISGVSGNVDLSHFYVDVAGWDDSPEPGPEPVLPGNIANIPSTIAYTTHEYTGRDLRPTITFEGLTIAVDWYPSYRNNVDVGTAEVTCYGMNGYTGYKQFWFNITPNNLPNNIILNEYNYTYTGSEIRPSGYIPKYVDESVPIDLDPREGRDYTFSYSNNVNVGTGTITATGSGNFTGSLSTNFNILAASINGMTPVTEYEEYIETGSAIEPKVTLGELVLNRDYTVAYSNNVNVGTATVTCTGIGNYTGTCSATFVIASADISTKDITIDPTVMEFTGEELKPTVTIPRLKEGTDFSVGYTNNINAGTGTVRVMGINGYTGIANFQFTIEPQSIETRVAIVSQATYEYTTKEITPKVSVEGLSENRDYTVEYKNNIMPGIASAIVTGKGNYTGLISCNFEILEKEIKNCVAKVGTPSIYTIFRIDGDFAIYNDNTETIRLTEGIDYEIIDYTRTNKGTHTVVSYTVKGLGGFVGSYAFNFRVIPKEPSAPTDLSDDGVYNFGDIDLDDETAEGMYDFLSIEPGDNEEYGPLNPNKVQDGEDYDFEAMCGIYLSDYDEDNGTNIDSDGETDYDKYEEDIEGKYNFGDEDLQDGKAVGDYDFGDEDEGVDPESVANGDYDFNVISGDDQGAEEEGEKYDTWSVIGEEFDLDDTPVYGNYGDIGYTDLRNGRYYCYSNILKNGRIRLTKWDAAIGFPVRSGGWFNVKDLSRLSKLDIGDCVKVTGDIYLNPNGTGAHITKDEDIMYISDIFEEEYEYNYALSTRLTTAVIGFAKYDMLEYVDTDNT